MPYSLCRTNVGGTGCKFLAVNSGKGSLALTQTVGRLQPAAK